MMELEKLKVLSEEKYVNISEVYSDDELSKKQDSYLMENNSIIGLNFKNVDIKDIINQILETETLKYLYLNNVNICFEDRLFFKCQNLQNLDLSGNELEKLPKEIFELKNLQGLNLSENKLNELPKEIFELKNLQSLDLSGNKLNELPEEIFQLKNLQSLNLRKNRLEKLSKEIGELKNLQNLDLRRNELEELPKEIFELKNLESLNLSKNRVEELPKKIFELKNLKNLDLTGKKLKELPKEIFELKNLQNLNLTGNELDKLPKELFGLKDLQNLNLKWNKLKSLPKELVELINLKSLDLSGNRFRKLPKEIFELKNLQSLNLTWNNLKELPREFVKLKNLQNLDLFGNRLLELPKEIFELNNIQNLNLSKNGLSELPKELFELRNLRCLSLSRNRLSQLPKELLELKNLQSLDLSANNFSELPKELFELNNLQNLNLSRNALSQLPKEVSKLKNLQSLDLSGNDFQELSKELFRLSRLSRLTFSHYISENKEKANKIKIIPNEFIQLTILNYFKLNENHLDSFYKTAYQNGLENLKNTIKQKVEQGTSKLYEAKLLFVGEPGAGKTSLMEKILDENYVLKDKSNEISTIGIDIKKHEFEYENIKFRVNMWDFGGQQIQYMSHQFFLTPNSLYILVGDDRKQHTDFDYWFHIINLLSDNSPILVVLNEINHKSITNFDLKAYKERFETHKIELENIDLSIADGKYTIVKQKIESMLFNLPHIGDELPAKWVDIRNELNIIAEKNYHIEFKEFKEICKKHGLNNDAYIKTLSNHFHNIGIFLHYSDDSNGLAEIIFLNPKWVMDGIYSVLADKTVNESNGKFSKEWLFKFWDNHTNAYSDEIKNKLLTLMLKDKFEISYKLENEDTYISPQLLPSILEYEYTWDYKDNLFYRFQYPFMPKGIVSRLIVRLNHLITKENNNELVWKKGVVLKYQNAKAQVIEKETKEGLKVIDISINGDKFDSQNLLSKIKNEIENIHRKSFPNLNFEEMIPCICTNCLKEKPYYYSFSTLKNYISKEKFFITCEKSVNDVSIAKLLGNVIIKDDDSKESQLLEYIKQKGLNLNINNNINTTSNSSTNLNDSMNMNQTQTVEIKISQTINQMLSELSSLKRKVEGEEDKKEITEIINEFKELGENPSKEEIIESGLLSDLKDKISEFDETMQDTGEVINKTKKAIQSAKSLGRTYNELASLCGLPSIPFFIVKE